MYLSEIIKVNMRELKIRLRAPLRKRWRPLAGLGAQPFLVFYSFSKEKLTFAKEI